MAITLIENRDPKTLAGLYTCEDSLDRNSPAGRPALILKVAGQRVYLRSLPRVYEASSGHRYKESFDGIDPCDYRENYCALKTLKYVCDTAAEAIQVSDLAHETSCKISTFEREAREGFRASVLGGNFPAASAPSLITEQEAGEIWRRRDVYGKPLAFAVALEEALIAKIKAGGPDAFLTYKGILLHAGDPKVAEHSEPEPLFSLPAAK